MPASLSWWVVPDLLAWAAYLGTGMRREHDALAQLKRPRRLGPESPLIDRELWRDQPEAERLRQRALRYWRLGALALVGYYVARWTVRGLIG